MVIAFLGVFLAGSLLSPLFFVPLVITISLFIVLAVCEDQEKAGAVGGDRVSDGVLFVYAVRVGEEVIYYKLKHG